MTSTWCARQGRRWLNGCSPLLGVRPRAWTEEEAAFERWVVEESEHEREVNRVLAKSAEEEEVDQGCAEDDGFNEQDEEDDEESGENDKDGDEMEVNGQAQENRMDER